MNLKDSGSKTENTESRKRVIPEGEVRSGTEAPGSDLMRTACLNNECQMAHTIF